MELLYLRMQKIFLMTLVLGFFMFSYPFDDGSCLFMTMLMEQVKWHSLKRHSYFTKCPGQRMVICIGLIITFRMKLL